MNKKDIFREIGFINENYIQEADIIMSKNMFNKAWVKITSIAACLALILGVGITLTYNQINRIKVTDLSKKVSVKYVNNAPTMGVPDDLVELSEKELFTKHDTSIFMGTILKADNIQIDLNGKIEYRAIAQLKVEKVYRGDCRVGDIVSVLLPCPIRDDIGVEDTETVSAMKEGMTGIFMPIKYTEKSFYETNGATLALKDIADYGFVDGVRYAFLKTDNGIVFSKWAYKSIESVTALDEIEAYIETMIK